MPTHPWLAYPWIQEQLDAAVAPYRGKWTDRQIQIFRERMVWAMATTPAIKSVVEQELYTAVSQSGETVAGHLPGAALASGEASAVPERGSKAR